MRVLATSGMSRLILESRWRRERLLVLCYHGLALEDEHQWDPALYIPPSLFRGRLQSLRRYRCNVLPFAEAIQRLDEGTLPQRSVALTFDDGGYDFYSLAWPILREFGYPVTLYFTTWYSHFNRPVFDVTVPYLLWKGRERKLAWPQVTGEAISLSAAEARAQAEARIKAYARENNLSGRQKDVLLAELAGHVGVDYEELCRKRLLHLMTEQEAAEVAAQGVDLQLHTHRHRVSLDETSFAREIRDNRSFLSRVSGGDMARHFCYPDGFHVPRLTELLKSQDIVTATTCHSGLISRTTDRWLLPRMVDSCGVSENEFAMWLSGIAALLPRRTQAMDGSDVLEQSPERPVAEQVGQ